MYQISLIAAYVAGMVALFAPCCISYLFPAYLGNVFKERRNVLFMTFVYSLGIFVVMMPIVLGAKALQSLFFELHDKTYLFGGIFMLVVAGLSFLGIKLPMPHIAISQSGGKQDIVSTFTLGIFSGITSACCAPVLVGVLALSSLTQTAIASLGVGASYVLGMVTPLYVASLFVHKKNILEKPFLKKVVTTVQIGNKTFPIFVSNIIATLIFGITGILMLYLTSIGKLGMTLAESDVTKSINKVAFRITDILDGFRFLDLVFAIIVIYLFYKLVKNVFMEKKEESKLDMKYFCPMHPEVVSDTPGTCDKCGGMALVAKTVRGKDHSKSMSHDHSSHMASPHAAKDFLHRFYIVSILLIPLFIFWKFDMPIFQFLIATIIFYFGLVFFQHARHEIMMKQYGMMTLVSIAVGAGYLFSAASTFLPLNTEFYLEISTLIWVLLFGHYLEAKSSVAAGDALSEVAKLLPKKATVVDGKQTKEVDLNSLKVGDIVRVLAGEKVPADGKIILGGANFNESHLTGESKPLFKKKNDEVFAGAICIDGSVEVQLMKVGDESRVGQIKKLIMEAGKTKPSAQKLADKAARYLTFVALAFSLGTALVWLFWVNASFATALTFAITVLVIACPHALGLAIPTVTTIATKLAVKNGLFIKDMAKMEIAKNANYVVFDKTGTLTKGDFGVSKVKASGIKENELIAIAASIEKHSSHLIGKAIVDYAKLKNITLKKVTNVRNIAGRGIEGTIGNKNYFVGKHKDISVALVLSNKVLGEIQVSDMVKPESKVAVKELQRLGIKVAMLTGDSEKVAKDVSKKIGLDTFTSEVLPEDKYKHIKQLQAEGNVVVMVGDGVNDAPSLTQSDVGIAIGAGTDVAAESGDVILTSNNPQDVVSFIKLSRKVYTKMQQNLFWALGYNALAIPAAAGVFIPIGFTLTPALGALLMSLSSVIVVINAITLKKAKL